MILDIIYFLVWVNYVRIKCSHDYSRALLWKMVTSFVFLVAAAICLNVTRTSSGFFLFIGLCFGFVGDYFLDMKYVVNDKRASDTYTFFGFGAFIVAHVMNIIGMALTDPFTAIIDTEVVLSRLLVSLIVSAIVVSTEKVCKVHFGKFKTISFVYGLILVFTTLLALELVRSPHSDQAEFWLFVGLVSFLLSDLVLSQTFFGQNKNTTPFIVANYVFYYAAQWFIAKSIGL